MLLKEIHRIEGNGAFWSYGQAVRLKMLAERGDRQHLSQAQKHLAEARALCPNWSRVPLLAAEIAEIEGHLDVAMSNYLQAVKLGQPSPNIVRRAAQLLRQHQREAEADRLLRRLDRD